MSKKRSALIVLLLVFIFLAFYLVYRFLIPSSISPGQYKTSIVDYGPVFTSVPASGIVNPKNEVLLLSPSASIISKIYLAPGSHVSKGDMIMALDTKNIQQEIESLKDQLGIMENDLQKNRLNARSVRVDLDYNVEVKNLKITSLKTEIADQEQLLKVGGISPALFEQTKQELVLAEKDLKTTQEKNSIRLKQLEADENGLLLQIEMRRKDLQTKLDLLQQMNIKASSTGILLSISGNEGEKVEKDKLLVRMSDLSNYKIRCSVDNKFVDDLKTGGEVFAIVENARLKGKIGSVSPVLTDKKINFDVFLDYSNFKKLIPNMEVDLMIVTHQKDSVLRIEKGPAFNKNKQQDVYVVRGNKAIKTRVETGLTGSDYIEVLSGLKPGDRVIISDVAPFRHRKEIDFNEL
ncbi:MAG TPA: efflux RND transporter periplasmic adaptor subunit [Bacteroidales bacterium]|nr:efflux RND transporter periplasmic adaptor subunit [Bacteroidales bacterium]